MKKGKMKHMMAVSCIEAEQEINMLNSSHFHVIRDTIFFPVKLTTTLSWDKLPLSLCAENQTKASQNGKQER